MAHLISTPVNLNTVNHMTEIELHDGYRHKLQAIKGKAIGENKMLLRWAERAHQAATDPRPYMPAVIDGLEYMMQELKRMNNELEAQ